MVYKSSIIVINHSRGRQRNNHSWFKWWNDVNFWHPIPLRNWRIFVQSIIVRCLLFYQTQPIILLLLTSRVYDPIWLILPTTIAMKMLLQQLWQLEWKYEPTDYMKFRWLLTISKWSPRFSIEFQDGSRLNKFMHQIFEKIDWL